LRDRSGVVDHGFFDVCANDFFHAVAADPQVLARQFRARGFFKVGVNFFGD
jgi:hypothetical protein